MGPRGRPPSAVAANWYSSGSVELLDITEEANIKAPVQVLWRFLYDTDRLNRSLGLPTVSYVADPDPAKKGHYAAAIRLGPIKIRYEEFPFEWVENRYYRVLRRFVSGPFAEMTVGVRLRPVGEQETVLSIFARVLPRNAIGSALAKLLVRKAAISGVLKQVRSFETGYIQSKSTEIPVKPPPVMGRQLDSRLTALASNPVRPDLVPRLRDLIEHGSDVQVGRIRPFELADNWGEPRLEVLRFFLHAAKAGVVDLNWEIVCPHCRAAATAVGQLSGLANQASCGSCEMTFKADFAGTVEAVFSVNNAVRPSLRESFCIGAPARSPRIIGQFRLEAGEKRTESVATTPGMLTARCYQAPGLQGLESTFEEKNARIDVVCHPGRFSVLEPRVKAGEVVVDIKNDLAKEALVVLERETWDDTAANASAVATIQEFRDLFPEQAVAPGQEIRVGRMAILFTDLQGSTELYSKIGDIRAFDFIHGHFKFLTDCVARNGGGVVKTIGDAVMAAFPSAKQALQASIDMQNGWGDFLKSQKLPSFVGLRVGFHEGAAVAFNNRGLLDYFGTSVNMAARVQGRAGPDEVVFSAPIGADPDVADLLSLVGKPVDTFSAELKGISGEQQLSKLVFAAGPANGR